MECQVKYCSILASKTLPLLLILNGPATAQGQLKKLSFVTQKFYILFILVLGIFQQLYSFCLWHLPSYCVLPTCASQEPVSSLVNGQQHNSLFTVLAMLPPPHHDSIIFSCCKHLLFLVLKIGLISPSLPCMSLYGSVREKRGEKEVSFNILQTTRDPFSVSSGQRERFHF